MCQGISNDGNFTTAYNNYYYQNFKFKKVSDELENNF